MKLQKFSLFFTLSAASELFINGSTKPSEKVENLISISSFRSKIYENLCLIFSRRYKEVLSAWMFNFCIDVFHNRIDVFDIAERESNFDSSKALTIYSSRLFRSPRTQQTFPPIRCFLHHQKLWQRHEIRFVLVVPHDVDQRVNARRPRQFLLMSGEFSGENRKHLSLLRNAKAKTS